MARVEADYFDQQNPDGTKIAIILDGQSQLIKPLCPARVSVFNREGSSKSQLAITGITSDVIVYIKEKDKNPQLVEDYSNNITFDQHQQIIILSRDLSQALVLTNSKNDGEVIARLAKEVKAGEK